MLRSRRFALVMILLVITAVITISLITGGPNIANMVIDALSLLVGIVSWLYINPFRRDHTDPLPPGGIFIPEGEEPLPQEQGIFIPKGEEKL